MSQPSPALAPQVDLPEGPMCTAAAFEPTGARVAVASRNGCLTELVGRPV
jgi:hypothetical protein